MRISDSSFFRENIKNTQNTLGELFRAQEEVATGLRVRKPSDDPVASSSNRALEAAKNRLNGYERSIRSGRAAVDVADTALREVTEVLITVRERGMQAANASLSANDRATMSAEIDVIREAIVGLANTRIGDDYVFSGLGSGSPTVDDAGQVIVNDIVRQVEVSPGVRVDTGVSGAEVFGGAGGGVNMVTILEDFAQALEINDLAGIQNALDDIDASIEQVRSAQAQLGSSGEAFEIATQVNEDSLFQIQVQQADLVEIDPTEAITRYQRANVAYQTAIQIATQLPPPGLVSQI